MVEPILRVLTFFAVVILILLLLNTLGGFIAAQIPNAVWGLRRIIDALWSSLQDITQGGFNRSWRHNALRSASRRLRSAFSSLASCVVCHSVLPLLYQVLPGCARTDRCLSGSTAGATRWCSRW